MEHIHLAVALDNNWENLTQECLRQIEDRADNTNVGFIYTTDYLAHELPNIIHKLKKETGIDHWFGTVGVGICAGDSEIYGLPAVTMMVCHIDEENYRVFSSSEQELSEFIQENAAWFETSRSHFGVVHADPRSADTSVVLDQLTRYIPDCYLVGGLSSSQTTYPQVAGSVSDGGVSGIIMNDKVSVVTSLTQGCSPIGPQHRITECDRNYIFRINDQPALQVFKQDIGDVLSRNLKNVAGYIFAGLPVSDPANENTSSDYKIRNLMGIDVANQVILIGDTVENGQVIQFCKRDNQSAWQDHVDTLKAVKKRLDKPVKGALYFSCLGRGRALFGENSKEIGLIHEHLGEFPLVGFFANGEIARNELYGYTGVLALFT